MITIQNRRNSVQFGNGLPFFKSVFYQNRNRNYMDWRDGCLISPRDRVPTFQVATSIEIDVIDILNESDNLVTTLSIGADGASDIIKKQLSDGRYLYICFDQPKGIGISGYFYIGLRVSTSPAGEYELVSEFFRCMPFNCYPPTGIPTPNV